MRGPILGALLILLPAAALGQVGNPSDFSNNPHPGMPWSPTMQSAYGTVVRYIPVAAQQVALDVAVSTPGSASAQLQRQVVEIPGYYVVETTTGYYYPERWTINQLNVGVYQWRKVPPEFRRK